MPQIYLINSKSRKLHLSECYYIKTNGDGYITYKSLNSALSDSNFKLSPCKHCLRDNADIESRLAAHNESVKSGKKR